MGCNCKLKALAVLFIIRVNFFFISLFKKKKKAVKRCCLASDFTEFELESNEEDSAACVAQ